MSEKSIRVILVGPRDHRGAVPTVDVLVPALPRVGDVYAHRASGIRGFVHVVEFVWSDGADPEIRVMLR